MKNWIEWHHWRCHGGGGVHYKVNEARKRVRNENCHQDAILRNIGPKPSQQIPLRTPFIDMAENFRVLGDFVWKLVEKCCSKTCVNFGRCYGNQRRAETVENQMLFFKISSFDKSESFNTTSRSSWDNLESLPGGGGGAQCAPPPPCPEYC